MQLERFNQGASTQVQVSMFIPFATAIETFAIQTAATERLITTRVKWNSNPTELGWVDSGAVN
jgi:hypothetical protein